MAYAELRGRLDRRIGAELEEQPDLGDVVGIVLDAALADLDGADLARPGRLSSWLRRVSERQVVDAIRRRARASASGVDPARRGDGGELDASGRVFAALRSLRPDQREVLLLRDVFGLPWARVVALLESQTQGAVRGLHGRARARLARALGRARRAPIERATPAPARSA